MSKISDWDRQQFTRGLTRAHHHLRVLNPPPIETAPGSYRRMHEFVNNMVPQRFLDTVHAAERNQLSAGSSPSIKLLLRDPGAQHGYSAVAFHNTSQDRDFYFPDINHGAVICDAGTPDSWLEWFALQRAESPGIAALQRINDRVDDMNTWGQLHRLWPNAHLLMSSETARNWPKDVCRASQWPPGFALPAGWTRTQQLAEAAAAKFILFTGGPDNVAAVNSHTHPIQYLSRLTSNADAVVAAAKDMVADGR